MQQHRCKRFAVCGRVMLALCLLSVCKPNWGAQQIDIARLPSGKSLIGVKKMSVTFFGVPDEAAKDGLNEEAINTDISLKFRLAGIPFRLDPVPATLAEASKFVPLGEPGEPEFNVRLEAGKRGEIYIFYITGQFKQSCLLERNPLTKVHATTWTKTAFGTVGAANIGTIREDIKDITDAFINDYLTMNPKK
jgi:hypothetical protein